VDLVSRALDLARRGERRGFDLRLFRGVRAVLARPKMAIALSIALVLVIGTIDYATGEARLDILYLVPVAVATSAGGRRWGVLASVMGVLAWGIAFQTQHRYSHEVLVYWDCLVLAVTLLLFVELLARLRAALERSDERFIRVLNGLDAAVFVSDEEQVLFANEWLLRRLGRDFTPSVRDIAARFPGTRDLDETPPHLPGHEVRDAVDGRFYLAQAGAITWIDGRRVRLTVLTDVTEQKRAQALQREHQAAFHHNARLVSLAEAATTLAHELNQPLIAIVGYNAACLRLLESERGSPQELATAMEKCRVQAVRAGEILGRIRDLTRRRTPTLSECDFNAMLREVLTWVQDDLDRAGVVVRLALAARLPKVHADRILVEQVMQNLVNNAVDAMKSVAPNRRRLTVETGVEDFAVRVTIADQGTGISAEVASRLFTPFFTTKERGLGLGLAICRSVVEMQGGRIWHEARPAGGTSFHFSIPMEAS
jgi:C4-dicarboxylate-specific signal transduction histidine kinase